MEQERDQERDAREAERARAKLYEAEAAMRETERQAEREREREEREAAKGEGLSLAAAWLRRQQDAGVEAALARRRRSLLRCSFRALGECYLGVLRAWDAQISSDALTC